MNAIAIDEDRESAFQSWPQSARDRLAKDYFRLPFCALNSSQRILFEIIAKVVCSPIDGIDPSETMCLVKATESMSGDDREVFLRKLEGIREQKRELTERYAAELTELEVIERYLMIQAGEPEPVRAVTKPSDYFVAQAKLGNATDSEAAVWALEQIGEATRVREIADVLRRHGYGTDRERAVLIGSLNKTLNRGEGTLFRRIKPGLWELGPKKKGGRSNADSA